LLLHGVWLISAAAVTVSAGVDELMRQLLMLLFRRFDEGAGQW